MKKKELNYYDELIKNANFALEISTILKQHIENFDYTKAEEMEEKVHKLEMDADKNLGNILEYLIKDFLPPIDREDIVTLAYRIDDVVDDIDEIVINLDILDVKKPREDIEEFIELVYVCCVNLKEMMIKFKDYKKYEDVITLAIEVNRLEEEGDKLYENAIRNLFQTEKDPIEVIKWNTIYNCLENAFDSCETVANCIEQIVTKNA